MVTITSTRSAILVGCIWCNEICVRAYVPVRVIDNETTERFFFALDKWHIDTQSSFDKFYYQNFDLIDIIKKRHVGKLIIATRCVDITPVDIELNVGDTVCYPFGRSYSSDTILKFNVFTVAVIDNHGNVGDRTFESMLDCDVIRLKFKRVDVELKPMMERFHRSCRKKFNEMNDKVCQFTQ